MVNVRREELPLSVVATETIAKSYKKFQNNIRDKHEKEGTTENSLTGH